MQRYIFFCTYKDFPVFWDCETPSPLHTLYSDRGSPTRHPYIARLVYGTATTQLPHSTEKTYIQLLPEKKKIRTLQKNTMPALPAAQEIITIL